MKKYNKGNFIVIVIILLIALVFSVSSLIMNIKNTLAYSYATYQTSFDYTVDASSVNVYSTLKNSNETFVEGYGPREVGLRYGRNNIDIKTKNGNNIDTYSIIINREDTRSEENRLKHLYVTNAKIDFDPDKYTYNVNVGENVDEVAINGSLMSDKAYYSYGFGPRKIELSEGLNVAFLKIKNEAGNEKQYKVNIFKNNNESTKIDNELNSISLDKANIDFKADKYEYDVDVASDVNKLEVYAFSNDEDDDIDISGNSNLKTGKNKITVEVNDSKKYVINVNRQKSSTSNKPQLKELNINGFDLKFKPEKLDYVVKLSSKRNLLVTAYALNSKDKVTISTNDEKTNLSTIKILVANDKDTTTYNIKVKKEYWDAKDEIISVLFTFVVGLGFISIIKYFEIKAKKKKQEQRKAQKKSATKTKKRQTTKKNK